MYTGCRAKLNAAGAEYCRNKLKLVGVESGDTGTVTWMSMNGTHVEFKFDFRGFRNTEHPWGTWMLEKSELEEA